jgi:hypothetical protein
MCQLLATLCVGSSLTLATLSGSTPSSGFCLQTLSFSRLSSHRGPIGDTSYVSLAVVPGVMYEE